jgi:perosamine synthetase
VNHAIPLFKIYWDEDDIELTSEVIKRGSSWTAGPSAALFEEMVSKYIGTKRCLAFNSGTSALHAILWAYDIGVDDEVIVPSFTFVATANAAMFVGATPVFADIEEETCGLDPDDVRRKITRKTRAILPIHYAGAPCRVRELRQVADAHDLVLIEDAAESLGASVDGRKAGSFGVI